MKVLIIGAAGFIGSTAAAHMIQNTDFSVVSIDDLSGTPDIFNLEPVLASRNRHTFYVADVFDQRIMNTILKLEKPNVILFSYDSKIDHRDHTKAFGALLETIYEGNNKVEKIVCILPDDGAIPENTSTFNNIVFVRPCRLFGHRQYPNNLVPTTIFRLLHEIEISPPKTNNVQEWLYIGDFLAAIILLIKSGTPKTYCVSAGFMATETEIINKLATTIGNCKIIEEGGSEMGNVSDIKDILEEGWIPTRGLDESLSHTARWYQTNEWAFRGAKW